MKAREAKICLRRYFYLYINKNGSTDNKRSYKNERECKEVSEALGYTWRLFFS